ncbi:leucyl aminopeptidase [Candidatus Woesearchaeota archaeon]|nr:MAG: leucyl aminopeptidase [Candidatus Woesearchaeota archaeon]
MRLIAKKESIYDHKTPLFVFGVFEGAPLPAEIKRIDSSLNGLISEKLKIFDAELDKAVFITSPKKSFLAVGLGKKAEFDLEKLRKASASALKHAREANYREFSTNLHEIKVKGRNLKDTTIAVSEGFLLASYNFTKFKTVDKDKVKSVAKAVFLSKNASQVQRYIDEAVVICESTNFARDLVNEPPCSLVPAKLAQIAAKVARENKLRIRVFGKEELKKMGMNALLAVGQGSANEPKLIVIEANPNAKERIALVGKGITFDSGGLNLKPTRWISEMKQDMAGAASVLAVVSAVKKLNIKKHVIGVIPTAENSVGSNSYRPDDIIKSFSGKNIEIINTDAEGRLILADALAYAETLKPDKIIDIATLTGASIVVLGYFGSCVCGNDPSLIKQLIDAGNYCYERVWELPMWEEHREMMKSDIADVRNVGKGKGFEAGVITGAAFLENFVEKRHWAHIDIGATAFKDEETHYFTKGGTGVGVRLLINFLMRKK